MREESEHNNRLKRKAEEMEEAAKAAAFDKRPFAERKTAFNLIQMARTTDATISADKVRNLIGTLIVSNTGCGELVVRALANDTRARRRHRKMWETLWLQKTTRITRQHQQKNVVTWKHLLNLHNAGSQKTRRRYESALRSSYAVISLFILPVFYMFALGYGKP